MMDDIEALRRKRAIKVLITDLFMAASVIGIVFVLVMAVAGWRINKDFKIEQNGLVSIKTKPTGATVIIDEEKEFQASNMSRMLPGGKHKVVLEKDGYERWEKEIEITPGWLYRLEYPKLFKQDREKDSIRDFETLSFFYVSPDRTTAILAEDNSTNWYVITDFNGTPKFKKIDIKGIFSGTADSVFNYDFKYIEWSKNDEKVLLNVAGEYIDDDGKTEHVNEWGLIDLKSIKNSINLSENYSRYEANSNAILASTKKTKSKNISSARFENEVGDKIIAVVNNNLVRIDTSAKVLSEALAEKVEKFEIYDSTVLFSTTFEEGKSYLKLLRLGEKKQTIVAVLSEQNAKISFSLTKFNSTSYVLYTINDHLYVHRAKEFQTGGGKLNMRNIIDEDVGIISSEAVRSFNNEFIVLREGSRVIVFDAELEEWHEYDYGDESIRFLDNFLLYRVDEASGTFLTWDFDSTNVRTLVVDKGVNDFDALISPNDHYFYYIAKTENGYKLIREKIN